MHTMLPSLSHAHELFTYDWADTSDSAQTRSSTAAYANIEILFGIFKLAIDGLIIVKYYADNKLVPKLCYSSLIAVSTYIQLLLLTFEVIIYLPCIGFYIPVLSGNDVILDSAVIVHHKFCASSACKLVN